LPEGGRKTKLREWGHRVCKVRHADQHECGKSIHGVSPNRFPTKIVDFWDARSWSIRTHTSGRIGSDRSEAAARLSDSPQIMQIHQMLKRKS
jgi:hypothetical protein